MTKILILRFSSIGDIVLTTPVIRCLKKQLPDAEIHFFTKQQFRAILEQNPYIDHLHVLDQPLHQKALALKQLGFDYVIDLHNNLRTRIIKSIIDVQAYGFEKLNFEKWLLVRFKMNLMPDVHIVDRYMETVKPLGVKNDEEGLDYFLPPNTSVSDLPPHFIAFAIGGQHFTKKLPNEKIIEICSGLQQPVLLLGGKEDAANGEQILLASGILIQNLCGKLSLHESAYVISKASKVITHDTGLMHIAAAFRKEVISVWGNTVPEFGMTPYYGKHHIPTFNFQISNLNCRPCSKIGFDHCPQKHFHCMVKQDMKTIANTVNKD